MMNIMSRSDVACYVVDEKTNREIRDECNQSRSDVACYVVNKQSNDKNGVVHNAATE